MSTGRESGVADGDTRRYAAALGKRYLTGSVTAEAMFGHFAETDDPLIQELLLAIAHEPRRGFFGISEEQWRRRFLVPISSIVAELEKDDDGDVSKITPVPQVTRWTLFGLAVLTLWSGALAIEHSIDLMRDSTPRWQVLLHGFGAVVSGLVAVAGAFAFRQRMVVYRFRANTRRSRFEVNGAASITARVQSAPAESPGADKLLTKIPESGVYQERHFNVSATSNAWVLFDLEPDPPWLGVFGDPMTAGYFDVVPFDHDKDLTLVIAGGQGYVVNRRTGALVRQTPWDYCYAALPVPGSDRIVLADPWRIWTSSPCTDTPAVAKTPLFPREQDLQAIALDGIIFRDVSAESLTGAYETPDGWFGFKLDFATMLITRGNKVATLDDGLYAESGRGFPLSEEAYHKALSHRLKA